MARIRGGPDSNSSASIPKMVYDLTGVFRADNGLTKDSSRTYPYEPLDFDTHEIRVLSLRVGGPNNDIINCHLEHMSLIDPRPYFALSYCWGDPSITDWIYLGEGVAIVTASLARALRAVMAAMGERGHIGGSSVLVWADAICIDQNNGQERSQQVRNMRQIYSRAEEVFAWAGEPLDGKVSQEAHMYFVYLAHPADSMLDRLVRPGSVDAASTLFREQYWRRVWVIQEITVATKVTILYGKYTLLWDKVATLLRSLPNRNIRSNSKSGYETEFHGPAHLLKFRDHYTERSVISLLDAMEWSRRTLATDPRDKIFALLGLTHDGPTFVPVPNYKQSLGKIIADMSKMMITLHKSLDFVCLRGFGVSHITEDLPSWAPNWPSIWSGKMTIQEEQILFKHIVCNENPILQGSSGQKIRVVGRRIGVVTKMATVLGSYVVSPPARMPRGWLSKTSELRTKNSDLIVSSRLSVCRRDTIWSTIIMSSLPGRKVAKCFESLWKPVGRGSVENLSLIQWIDDNAWFKVGEWTLREWSQVIFRAEESQSSRSPPRLPPGPSRPFKSFLRNTRVMDVQEEDESDKTVDDKALDFFIKTLHRVLSGGMRLVCIDYNVCPVAMAHLDVEIGDEILFLRGCQIPVVLRKCTSVDDNEYMVIGGAFLAGIYPEFHPDPGREILLC